MKLQQTNQKERKINFEEIYCPPNCVQCLNFKNDGKFNGDYEICAHSSSSLVEPPNNMDEHEPKLCPCPRKCRMPMCSPFFKRKYIQPPRQSSCKPTVCYEKPSLPFANETIYKKSFELIDSNTAACCRLPIIRPKVFLKCPDSAFEKKTVTQVITDIIQP